MPLIVNDRLIRAAWDAPANVDAFVTTRGRVGAEPGYDAFNLATHTGDDPAAVEDNRRALARLIGTDRIQWMRQVHGVASFHAGMETLAGVPQADAAWTDCRGIALAVLTADCVPLLLADRAGSIVAVAHAGWRGLQGGVLARLIERLPVGAPELVAWIGPAIGVDHYEVGEDVWSHFVASDVDALRPHPDEPSKRMLDLARVAHNQLIRAGVSAVAQSRLCTFADGRFYSYRRHQKSSPNGNASLETGRFASIVLLRESG
jgi:YfiH family protein